MLIFPIQFPIMNLYYAHFPPKYHPKELYCLVVAAIGSDTIISIVCSYYYEIVYLIIFFPPFLLVYKNLKHSGCNAEAVFHAEWRRLQVHRIFTFVFSFFFSFFYMHFYVTHWPDLVEMEHDPGKRLKGSKSYLMLLQK